MESDFNYTPVKRANNKLAASATVEAAIVMPLFIYAVMSVMFLLRIIQIKSDINVAVYNSIRELSKYAYTYNILADNNELINMAAVYACMNRELGEDYGKNNHIVGGNFGIVFLGSGMSDENSSLKIHISYVVKNPFDIWGLGLVSVTQQFECEAWLGEEKSVHWQQDKENDCTVFITQYGEVYHTKRSCPYLTLSVKEVSTNSILALRNYSGGKYYPCEGCASEFIGEGELAYQNCQINKVYVTNYGDRFHTDINCKSIKRTVIEVQKSKVGNRRLCGKCGG